VEYGHFDIYIITNAADKVPSVVIIIFLHQLAT